MIKILTVVVLVAALLVVSIPPALARPAHFGKNLHANPSCDATDNAQNIPGAQHVINPPGQNEGCWVVLPGKLPDQE
jgi:hypothetical protein